MSDLKAVRFSVPSKPSQEPARPNCIMSETLAQNDDVKIVLFHFSAGQELSEHTAAIPAMIHQVSGRARWQLGDVKFEAGPGEWAYMPANLSHSIHAIEDCAFLLMLLKKPAK